MTDLMPRTAWHTTATPDAKLAAARNEITDLTDRLRWVEHCRSQAEESVKDEKDATAVAEQRADAEADRADGAEAHLRRVLVEFVVEPATGELEGVSDRVDTKDVPGDVMESIAESLMEDLDGGLRPDELSSRALHFLQGWAEEQ